MSPYVPCHFKICHRCHFPCIPLYSCLWRILENFGEFWRMMRMMSFCMFLSGFFSSWPTSLYHSGALLRRPGRDWHGKDPIASGESCANPRLGAICRKRLAQWCVEMLLKCWLKCCLPMFAPGPGVLDICCGTQGGDKADLSTRQYPSREGQCMPSVTIATSKHS